MECNEQAEHESLLSNQPRGVELDFRVIAVKKAGAGQPSATVTVVLWDDERTDADPGELHRVATDGESQDLEIALGVGAAPAASRETRSSYNDLDARERPPPAFAHETLQIPRGLLRGDQLGKPSDHQHCEDHRRAHANSHVFSAGPRMP